MGRLGCDRLFPLSGSFSFRHLVGNRLPKKQARWRGEGAEALWGRGLALLVRNATLAVGRKFWALSPNVDSVTPKI